MTVLCVIGGLWLSSMVVTVWLFVTAPSGVEDEDGFRLVD